MSRIVQIIAGLALAFCLLAQESLLHAGENAAFTYLWGGFATSLTARSAQQRHNSIIAARDLDGLVIPPGGVFSFNERIGARERGKGYAAAPHIDAQGLLQDTPGGGICQLASTIYNAGLQAGMTVLERHPHSRAVGHVPPGRDATISSWRKDLKLGNPFPHPLQLRVGISRDRLSASFNAPVAQPFRTEIITTRSQLPAETIVRSAAQTNRQAGAPGYRVTARRIMHDTAGAREELLSEDTYPAPSRIIGQ